MKTKHKAYENYATGVIRSYCGRVLRTLHRVTASDDPATVKVTCKRCLQIHTAWHDVGSI